MSKLLRQSFGTYATPLILLAVDVVAFVGAADRAMAQTWRGFEPPQRSDYAAVHDWIRGRTVMFGGRVSPSLQFADTWEFDGTEWREKAIGSGPAARSYHAMAFDDVRGRVVMFGGSADTSTWEFDGTNWLQRPLAGPPARQFHSMTFDSARGRVVMFGGGNSSGFLGDTWEFDGTTWTLVPTPAGPSPRMRHAMTFDLIRGRTVLFGGHGPGSSSSDTWEYDGVSWMQIATPQSPPGTVEHAMAYDVLRNRVVLHGGSSNVYNTHTWEYDGVTWTRRATNGPPSRGPIMAYSPTQACCTVLHLGWRHTYDGSRWNVHFAQGMNASMDFDAARQRPVLLAYTVNGPAMLQLDRAWMPIGARLQPSTVAPLAYDIARDEAVVFGGLRTAPINKWDETWVLRGSRWIHHNLATGPAARNSHSLAYDPVRRRVVLFGGWGPGGMFGDTWEFDGTRWIQSLPDNPGMARILHKMSYDAGRNRIVMFGGQSPGTTLGDTHEYDGSQWRPVNTPVSPPARNRHTMWYHPTRGTTIVYGGTPTGWTWTPLHQDLWEFDGTTWTRLSSSSPLPTRQEACVAYDAAQDRVVIHGGLSENGMALHDTWELRLPPAATIARHGTGCPDLAGIPTLGVQGTSAPVLGTSFTLQGSSLPNVPGVAILVLGTDVVQWNGFRLPVALGSLGRPDCMLWVSADALNVLPVTNGSTSFSAVIPSTPALAGVRIGGQILCPDPNVNTRLAAASNGVLIVLR